MLHRFRHYVALGLLLAFARVLLPDAAILALHEHEHTAQEAAHDAGSGLKGKIIVSEKHSHCPTDHLFNAPALPAPAFEFGVVPPLTFARPVGASRPAVWPARLVETLNLRGPPRRA